MAYQGISTGTGPNQGNGDTLVDGAVKINSNFSEIYNALGNGSTINLTTNKVSEGSNLYYTDERAQDAVGSAINAGTQSGITVTYDDSNNRINFSVSSQIPAGVIVMWSGSVASIPSGWVLCNGSNGTPDLRGRFIVGAGSAYNPGNTGGSANATLVRHTHAATSSVSDPGHSHTDFSFRSGGSTYFVGTLLGGNGTARTSTESTGITVSTSVSTEGSSGTNANLPPYYALAYIMKTA